VRLRRLLAVLLALLMILGGLPSASAQQRPGTAEVKRATGRVEVLRTGQTQWLPAVVGARLAEGDNVRAFSGASAELELPDGTTLLVAENSRIIVSKLDFDPQNQNRLVVFHLVVGKAVAAVTQATLTLIRARQSNFVITTPTAVAAARGTHIDVTHDGEKNVTRVAVLEKDDKDPAKKRTSPGLVVCTSYADKYRPVNIIEGHYSEVLPGQTCAPMQPNTLLSDFDDLGTARNPLPATPQQEIQMSAPATPPPLSDILGLIAFGPTGVFFSTGASQVTDVVGVSALVPPTVGVDLAGGPPAGVPPGPPPGVPPGPPCPTPAPSPPPPCPP